MNVLMQLWEESERDWGVRPDGYSLHIDEQSLKNFVRDYWDNQPQEVPDEYSRPCFGNPFLIEVDNELYKEVLLSKNGIRKYS